MEYEIFEPDVDEFDEFYNMACSAAYSRMFNEGRDYSGGIQEYHLSFISRADGN